MKYYKWTAGDFGVYASSFRYDKTGAWMEASGDLKECVTGFHAVAKEQVPLWCGTELWEVEVSGDCIEGIDKSCHRRMRFVRQLKWNLYDVAAFAEWCATRACDAYAARAAANAAANAAYAAARAAYAARDAANAARAARAAYAARDAAEQGRQLAWIENRIGEKLE